MTSNSCGTRSTGRPSRSCAARADVCDRRSAGSSTFPEDGFPRSPSLEFQVHADIRDHEGAVPDARVLEDLAALLLALEGEDRPEEAEVDLDRLVDVHRPREARAAREDRTDHLDSAGADALALAATNDPPVRPFAGLALGVILPRVGRVHVEETLRILPVVR